jgi:hypothetical protein
VTEVYQKIRQAMGVSPLQQAGLPSNAPPGSGYGAAPSATSILNSPIYNQLFPNESISAMHIHGADSPSGTTTHGGLSSPPPNWSQSVAEAVIKVDIRFKVRSLLFFYVSAVFT